MLRVFYSWISDEPRNRNRMFVYRALTEALHQAADRLEVPRTQAEVVQCDRFDHPTDIAGYILRTIPTCHALVGDVSFINASGEERTRRTPNPNTMFEVGLAMQCLGPERVILVFNEGSGPVADLPFDLRNHSVLTWSEGATTAPLARDLQRPVEAVFQDYLTLVNRLAQELDRCFGPLLSFLEQFMRRHIENEAPGFTAESMALFDQGQTGELLTPMRVHVARLLSQYQRQFLDAPSAVGDFTEGNLFAFVLQSLHHDCEWLAYRYRPLSGSDLFRHVEQVGVEARHLERLVERVSNKVPPPLVNDILVDELLRFLRHVIEARRQVARCATSPDLTA
jgi:hypothetical protein